MPIRLTVAALPPGLVLGRRQQPRVPRRERMPVQPRDAAEHGQGDHSLARPPQHRFVPRAARSVEDHARDRDVGIQPLAAQHHRGRRPRALGAVHHEDHRRLQQLGELRRAVAAERVHPVEQPAVPLDHGHVRALRGGREGAPHRLRGHQEQVEVAARGAGGLGEPGRIDVVGPLLERRHGAAALAPRGDEAHRDERLAAAAAQPRDHHAWSRHRATPSR